MWGLSHKKGGLGEEGLLSDSPRHAIACHPPLRGRQGPLSEGGAACRWHANSTDRAGRRDSVNAS